MTLPAAPPISISMVRTEFNGTGYNYFSQYTRGGGRVPVNASTASVSSTAVGLRLTQFYSAQNITPHSVTKSGDAYGSGQTGTPGGTVTATTNSVTANVANGVGPFTYAWSFVSGTTATVNSASSATTSFTRSRPAPSIDGNTNTYSGVYRCTVTDTGNGNLTASVDVNVVTDHTYNFV